MSERSYTRRQKLVQISPHALRRYSFFLKLHNPITHLSSPNLYQITRRPHYTETWHNKDNVALQRHSLVQPTSTGFQLWEQVFKRRWHLWHHQKLRANTGIDGCWVKAVKVRQNNGKLSFLHHELHSSGLWFSHSGEQRMFLVVCKGNKICPIYWMNLGLGLGKSLINALGTLQNC